MREALFLIERTRTVFGGNNRHLSVPSELQLIDEKADSKAGRPMTNFSRARVVPADDGLLDRALDAAFAGRSQGLDRAAYGRWDAAQRQTGWAAAHQRRFALMDGGALLATAVRRDLTGVLDGLPLSIGAFGSIWGDDGTTTRGAARHLLERMASDAELEGADAALVFAPADKAAMIPEGFRRLPVGDAGVRVVESARRGAPMILVRAGEERDLPAIVAMSAQRCARYRFSLTRDVPVQKHHIARMRMLAGLGANGSRQLEFLIAEEGITAAAYVVISRFGTSWIIEECGDRDESGARVGAILQSVIAREPAEQRPVISGWFPLDFRPPQLAITVTETSADAAFVRFFKPSRKPVSFSAGDVMCWHSDGF